MWSKYSDENILHLYPPNCNYFINEIDSTLHYIVGSFRNMSSEDYSQDDIEKIGR